MSRYVKVLQTGLTQQQARDIAAQYLQGEGFKYLQDRGENVWRKGVGWLAAPQFIKAEAAPDGTVRVEAWTAGIALLPGVYGGEMDPMTGAYGWAVKAALKPRVAELERRLGGQAIAEAASTPAAAWYPDPSGRHQQRYWDGAHWTGNVADNGQPSVDPEAVS